MPRYVLTIIEQIKLQRICASFRKLFLSLYANPRNGTREKELMYQLSTFERFFEDFCGENKDRYKPKGNVPKQARKLNGLVSNLRLKLQTLGRDQKYIDDTLRQLQNALNEYERTNRTMT